jgi:hypothetical protein
MELSSPRTIAPSYGAGSNGIGTGYLLVGPITLVRPIRLFNY